MIRFGDSGDSIPANFQSRAALPQLAIVEVADILRQPPPEQRFGEFAFVIADQCYQQGQARFTSPVFGGLRWAAHW